MSLPKIRSLTDGKNLDYTAGSALTAGAAFISVAGLAGFLNTSRPVARSERCRYPASSRPTRSPGPTPPGP